MRFLLCLTLVLFGCVASLPGDDVLTADMACETARMVVQMRRDAVPQPAPEPNGECCKQCKGTGFITHGDGHKTPCPCPPNCPCKKTKAVVCTTGTCR